MTDTKPPRTRTPRSAESIQVGVLALPLKDRVQLVKVLKESIQTEVDNLTTAAKEAATIANGTES